MTDVLTSRDGLIGNSPRYTNSISPPYQRYLKDDAGNAINLAGVSPSALSIVFVNQSNPLTVKAGAGTFTIPSGTASQGLALYQYASADLATPGNWYAFWTVQLTGEPSPRAFDPDFLSIIQSPSGGIPIVTIQDVNLTEVNGTAVSSSNPVPTSGPVTAVDGAIATIGATTDASSTNTTIGLLKAIKAYLAGTLTTSLSGALPAGTNVIGHVIVDSAGAVTITTLPSIPAGSNVIGHVVVDSASNVSVTALPALPAGANTIGGVKLIDSAGTNVAGVDSSNNQLVKVNAALPAGTNVIGHVVVDSAGSVSVTSLPSIPAGTNVIGHVIVDSGSITANAGTNLNTSLLALESGGNLASIKSDADSIKTYTSAFADSAAVTGTVTNDGDVVSIALPGGQATVLTNILLGTLVGTLLFEASPDSGTTWVSVSGAQAGTSSVATSTTSAGVWRIGVAGFTNFRIRLHPTVSGTSGTITLRVTQGAHNVAVTNTSVLGQTTMANSAPVVLASDEIVPVKASFTEVASLSAGSLNADLVTSTDVSAYKWWSLHIAGTWSGRLTFQCSNDNVNWGNLAACSLQSQSTTTTSTTVNDIVGGPVVFRYLRVRMTTYSSGTATGTLELYTTASQMAVSGVLANQNGTWTVQPGNVQNTTSWVTKGATNNGTQAANTASNTAIKGSAGTLYSATVTTTGTAGLVVYDNASTNSGTILLSIPANATVGTIYAFPGGMPAANGITSAGVSNCPGVTFAYGPA